MLELDDKDKMWVLKVPKSPVNGTWTDVSVCVCVCVVMRTQTDVRCCLQGLWQTADSTIWHPGQSMSGDSHKQEEKKNNIWRDFLPPDVSDGPIRTSVSVRSANAISAWL